MHPHARGPHRHVTADNLTVHEDSTSDFQRGLEAFKSGDRSGAFSGFLMALAQAPENSLYRRHALELLGTTGGYTTLPAPVLEALAGCADDPTLDLQPLALVVKILLANRVEVSGWIDAACDHNTETFNESVENGLFDALASDPMIDVVLRRTTNVSLALEDILTGIRRQTLLSMKLFDRAPVLNRHPAFFDALIVQAERTDFAWAETGDEAAHLRQMAEDKKYLGVRGAYRRDGISPVEEFPAFTQISDSMSLRVQSQYTAYPYPRWETVPSATPVSLRQFLKQRFPKQAWSDRLKGVVSGLSAGCGTGRGALMLARSIKDLNLTAIDLSSASLAFAAGKARDLNLDSITFGLGDILELGSMNATFDVIECSGVLHHMDDPLAGLHSLATTLAGDGAMRVALYSERARVGVIAAQQWVVAEGLEDSHEGVRQARAALRTLPDTHPAKSVTETPDFFNLSGLHDLIFNVKEHRFTPQGVKKLLQNVGLQFLGFDHFNLAVPSQYTTKFGDDVDQTNLDNWDAFEQNNPDTFSEMYQVWCRPDGR